MRHEVYASELGQHVENEAERLTDQLDAVNFYLVAKIAGKIVGFVSITPPNALGFSIDKYFAREELPLVYDQGLYEIRLLTVTSTWRGSFVAALLLYGALRYVESLNGQTIIAIGRLEVLKLYQRAGMRSLGRQVRSGQVIYELISAKTNDLRELLPRFRRVLSHLERNVDWRLTGVNFNKNDSCYHGGDFFEAIGNEFDDLRKKDDVINADVLDAWFDPAPRVLAALATHLPWIMKTSPPTGSEGMRRMIAQARGVQESSILPGAGSSDLIFLGLSHWLCPESRVLILDPMYGEYAHVLENVIGCRVERLTLSRAKNYAVDTEELAACLEHGYDWVILVNPNSPTGRHIERKNLEFILQSAPKTTRFWIDETYIEFVDPAQSLEPFAADSTNAVVCKSMSKAYALSGVRCAYLCGSASMMDEIRVISPPWAVSLPGQIAACEALRSIAYYRERWSETHRLRDELSHGLSELGWEVIPGCANFLLCHLPPDQPEAAALITACRQRKLFVRDVGNMGHCFDKRTIRIAVKDAATNLAMLTILKMALGEIAASFTALNP
jgi:histidinol-phosphate/aromatic aminotransferase/cobyric acid decarboxylase-like protein